MTIQDIYIKYNYKKEIINIIKKINIIMIMNIINNDKRYNKYNKYYNNSYYSSEISKNNDHNFCNDH